MNLLILYSKNTQEVFNRKSAIGSYINCLGNLIDSESVSVYLNGHRLNQPSKNHHNPEVNSQSFNNKNRRLILSAIKSLVPNYIKKFLRDKQHLKKVDQFKNELLNSEIRYDAILEFYTLGSDVGYSISKKQNIPLYITYDGPIIEEYVFFNSSKPFFLDQLLEREKKSLQQAKKIVAYSNPMKEYIKTIANTDSIFIHQNVDFTRFDVLEEDKNTLGNEINLCFIGSFLKWHQVDLLVNAFVFLLENNINATLYLVGDGLERKSIQSYVNSLTPDVKTKIFFTGFLDGQALFDLKKRMHIGVMPGSNWYGAPNKIFEYGAMKMAVVAPNTPTITDLFSGKEVSFFEWKSQLSLNKTLQTLANDKKLIESNALILNKKITDKYAAKNTIDFYTELFK